MELKYRIHLYHDGNQYVAEVPELPGCQGVGTTYAKALQAAENAIAARISSPAGNLGSMPPSFFQMNAILSKRTVAARKHGPVKGRLIEKYGDVSNRELAAKIGLFTRDAPAMLSGALGGHGSRRVRCIIAVALDELPSKLWPELPNLTTAADDRLYIAVKENLTSGDTSSKKEVELKSGFSHHKSY